VSLTQDRLGSIVATYGCPQAQISSFPTLLMVALRDGEPGIAGPVHLSPSQLARRSPARVGTPRL
jgi:hypothetical protein